MRLRSLLGVASGHDCGNGRDGRSARVPDYGDQALLLEFDNTAEVLAWTDALRDAELLGVVDIVPASRTVLLKLDRPRYQGADPTAARKLQAAPDAVQEAPRRATAAPTSSIDVVYDGADLDEVARLTGIDPQEVVAAHTGDPVARRIRWFRTGFRVPDRR